MKQEIDFVILWVDGNDPMWLAEKNKYSVTPTEDASQSRYREWNNLKYVFRGIEKFAPWVRKVHFITWGHLPEWMNTSCPKLNIICHKDYIPEAYLPTFSSKTIEHNLFRISDLAETFVLFNDDTFILRPLSEEVFFDNGIPRHPIWLRHIVPEPYNYVMPHVYLNDTALINRYFKAIDSYHTHQEMWESSNLEEEAKLQNRHFLRYDKFPGFRNEHMPVPILKTTMQTIWDKEFNILNRSCLNRFRSAEDVSQYIYRYWQIASGNCVPIAREMIGKYYVVKHDNAELYDEILFQKHPMICINDMDEITDEVQISAAIKKINDCFEKILPERCNFEKADE